MNSSKTKILITGGAGFIGSHLVERLLKMGEEVVCLDNFNDFYDPQIKRNNIRVSLENPRFNLAEGDIRDLDFLDNLFGTHRFDMVIHLAAMAGVRPSIEQPQLYNEVNVMGTTNLLEQCKLKSIKKFIFGSSSSVYGINSKVPFSEEDRVEQAISPYGATKLAGEVICHTYHHLYGISVVSLRFFTVYGPRQRPEMAIHKFIRLISSGEEVPMYGDGSSCRDYTYVDDIIDGIVASVSLDCRFEIINLGNSRTIKLKDLISLMEKQLGKRAKIKPLPNQPGDVPITYADISKARRLLNYHPNFPIEKGLAKMVDWYLEEINSI